MATEVSGRNEANFMAFFRRINDWKPDVALEFASPPTVYSPAYTLSPMLYNANDFEGNGCLLESKRSPQNKVFIDLQSEIFQWFNFFKTNQNMTVKCDQTGRSLTSEKACQMLCELNESLESFKGKCWEAVRLTHVASEISPPGLPNHPITMLVVFIPMFLSVYGGCSRRLVEWASVMIRTLVVALLAIIPRAQDSYGAIITRIEDEVIGLPKSLEGLRQYVNKSSATNGRMVHEYICCTRCWGLYCPKTMLPVAHPTEYHMWKAAIHGYCTFQLTLEGKPCNAWLFKDDAPSQLDKSGSLEARLGTRPFPKQKFCYSSLPGWICDLIKRPGMTDALEIATNDPQGNVIMQSKCIKALRDSKGQPFAIQMPGSLRICFGLFIDWFNANGNTIRGTKHGTGGIYLIILNLPEQIRFNPENMFQLFIPGPMEPTSEQLCNVIRPLINDLIGLFSPGMTIQTQVGGAKCFAMLALVIADLKAAKKIGGYAATNHKWFCALCRQPERSFRHNIDPETWAPALSDVDHRKFMNEWKALRTLKERNIHFSVYGIRYSELERLEYLKFSLAISLEPMHALHNIIQPHIRRVFNLSTKPQMDLNHQDLTSSSAGEDEYLDGETDQETQNSESDGDNESVDLNLDDMGSPNGEEENPSSSAPTPQSRRKRTLADDLARGDTILRRSSLDWASLHILNNMSTSSLQELCLQRRISFLQIVLHNGKPTRAAMVEKLVCWFKNRTSHDIEAVDTSQAVEIIMSPLRLQEKRKQLELIPRDVLYELSVTSGLRQSKQHGERATLWPTNNSMIEHILVESEAAGPSQESGKNMKRFPTIPSQGDTEMQESESKKLPYFNHLFMKELWEDMKMLHLPENAKRNAAPSTFGLKRHGTLSAAQWYNVCCFNLFVTLSRHWTRDDSSQLEKEWMQNYYHLCSLVRISHIRIVEPGDIVRLRYHTLAYVSGFRRLFPERLLRPSHHYLLHLADQVDWFGAMPGRWAFPLERRNGQVQRLNTNHKQGEIEQSYAKQSIALMELQTWLELARSPTVETFLLKTNHMMGTHLPTNSTNTSPPQHGNMSIPVSLAKYGRLTIESRNALEVSSPLMAPEPEVLKLPYIEVNGQRFRSAIAAHHGTKGTMVEIFDGELSKRAPRRVGLVYEIFIYPTPPLQGSRVLVGIAEIERRTDSNPFRAEPDVGADLFTSEIKPTNYILVDPSSISQVAYYQWDMKTLLVISI